MYQDLKSFRIPDGFRGRSGVYVQIWWFIQATLFRWSPQFAYGFRRFLLRVFGAKVGRGVVVRPTVTITYPWKVEIGDYSWVGDDVVLYSLGKIFIGDNTVVSQRSYICAGDHDCTRPSFPIRGPDIYIGNQNWLATDVFVAPGVRIGDGNVVGARSSVFKDLPDGMICMGSPCVVLRPRTMGVVHESIGL